MTRLIDIVRSTAARSSAAVALLVLCAAATFASAAGAAESPPALLPSPNGVPIEVIADGESPAIKVGDPADSSLVHTYPMAPGDGAIQMLVLDRTTLEPSTEVAEPNHTFSVLGRGEADIFKSSVAAVGDESIVILNGGGRTDYAPPEPSIKLLLDEALALVGLQPIGLDALAQGQWSGIGVPGSEPGGGYQISEGRELPGMSPGSLSGRLRPDSERTYSFAWPASFVSFDTYADGAGPRNSVIAANGKTYSSGNLAAGETGWHLVVLDGSSLQLIGNYTLADAGPSYPESILREIQALAESETPPLILLRSIGRPSAVDPVEGATEDWGTLATELVEFGGNANVLLALNGTGDYALVGRRGMATEGSNGGAELNQSMLGAKSPRAVGTLERNHQGLWRPSQSKRLEPGADLAAAMPGVQAVLALPEEPYPPFVGAGPKAAEAYIAEGVGFDPPTGESGIRSLYWSDDNIDWDSAAATLQGLSACSAEPCAAAYPTVEEQLHKEFLMVNSVREFFVGSNQYDLHQMLTEAFTVDKVSALDVVDAAIRKELDRQPKGQAGGINPLEILGAMTNIASPVAEDDPAAMAGFALVEGLAGLFGPSLVGPDGSPVFGVDEYTADADEFASKIGAKYTLAISRLDLVSNLLLSDWGRLQAAHKSIDTPSEEETPYGSYGWGLNSATEAAIQARLTRSMYSYVWQGLLPLTTNAYYCVPPSGWQHYIHGGQPWKYPIVSPGSASDNYVLRSGDITLGTSSGHGAYKDWSYPSASIFKTLFEPWKQSEPGGSLGLQPLYTVFPSKKVDAAPPGFRFDYGERDELGEYDYECGGDGWTAPEREARPPATVSPPGAVVPAKHRKIGIKVAKTTFEAALRQGVMVRVANADQGAVVRMHVPDGEARRIRIRTPRHRQPVEVGKAHKRTARQVEKVRVRFHPWAARALAKSAASAVRVRLSVDGYPTKRFLVLRRSR